MSESGAAEGVSRATSMEGGGAGFRELQRPLGWIDVLRHLLAIAVILQHMEAPNRYPAFLNAYILNSSKLVDCAVAGFFLISGLFARPDRAFSDFPRQARRLLAPYILFSVLYAAALIMLHKTSLRTSVLMLVSGLGVGAQLYFLPYLLFVSTATGAVFALGRKGMAVALIAVLFVSYLLLPTAVSTGPEPRLLALYALTFTVGYYRATFATPVEVAALVAVALATVVLVPWQSRYFDLGLIIVLVEIVLLLSRRAPLRRRLPGSGGVYLLHTPVLNYTVSSVLMSGGVTLFANLFWSIAITYAAALGITLLALRLAPTYRSWLLE